MDEDSQASNLAYDTFGSSWSWVKSSSAYYPPRLLASRSSTVVQIFSYNLMLLGTATGASENTYTLSALLRRQQSEVEPHTAAYQAINQWLVNEAQIPDENILIDHKIAGMEGCCTLLWTSECKRPDLQIISANKCVLVQIEVDSGDMESTHRKLGIGLVDQLRWLRNHGTSITKCGGFYFMSGSSGSGHVIHIEVVWEDKHLKFFLKRQRLPMDSVIAKVEEVMAEAQRSLDLTGGGHVTDFALPLSRDFIQARFGAGAIQLPSGQSVVIANLETRKVYKHCLNDTEGMRVMELIQLFSRKPGRSVFPDSVGKSCDVSFFVFPLLKPPLLSEQARQKAKAFVGSVHEAITELHEQFNLAHLDVRLGNICISAVHVGTPLIAKLIDLDRSEQADKACSKSLAASLYTTSIMYQVREGEDWTLSRLDWRQLGIMVFAFLNALPAKSYHSRVPQPNSGFLKDLVEKGVYTLASFTDWDPQVDILIS